MNCRIKKAWDCEEDIESFMQEQEEKESEVETQVPAESITEPPPSTDSPFFFESDKKRFVVDPLQGHMARVPPSQSWVLKKYVTTKGIDFVLWNDDDKDSKPRWVEKLIEEKTIADVPYLVWLLLNFCGLCLSEMFK